MYKSTVYTSVNSHSDVYVPGLETSALTFSFTLYTRNRGARGTDNQRQIWTKSSEFLNQGLSRTAWKMQKHHSASFCRWDHDHSLTEKDHDFWPSWSFCSHLTLLWNLDTENFGRAGQTRQQRWRVWSKTWWECGSLSILLFPSWRE